MPNAHYTVLEYVLKSLIVLVSLYQYVIILTPSITFFGNCHDLLKVGFVHIKSIFKKIDELSRKGSESNWMEMKMEMIKVIDLHNRLLE